MLKISLHFLLRKKLLGDWRKECACTVITEWEPQPWEQSLKSADKAVLAAPILSALCAGTRHCSLVAHILPPPPPLFFGFSCSFVLLQVWRETVGVDGVMWLQISIRSLSLLSVKDVWSPGVMCESSLAVSSQAETLNMITFHVIWRVWVTILWYLLPQTPDSWTDKTQSRRGNTNSHKRSASWGSAEHLQEVNLCLYCATCVFVGTWFAEVGVFFCIKERKLLKKE